MDGAQTPIRFGGYGAANPLYDLWDMGWRTLPYDL